MDFQRLKFFEIQVSKKVYLNFWVFITMMSIILQKHEDELKTKVKSWLMLSEAAAATNWFENSFY